MPELPEVETVISILKKKIIGRTIIEVNVLIDKIIKNKEIPEFKKMLIGETFKDIRRKGKHIIFLTKKYCLVCHLRMEGKFFFLKKDVEYEQKHTLLTFLFSDQYKLNYHDTRRFGTFHIYPIIQYEKGNLLSQIGLEPFDKKVNIKYLKEAWSKKRKPIKAVLLEQNIICGIGNIYACEILYDARINPFTPANKLTNSEIKLLIASTRNILKRAIRAGGTTVSSFLSGHNISGKFQNELVVYGKQGMPCVNCGTIILKRKIAGRGTFFCPKEQNVTKNQL